MRFLTALTLCFLALPLAAAEDGDKTLQALRFGTVEAREAALDEVLAGRVAGAGPALLESLPDAQGAFKLKVIRALGVVREDKAVKPLLALLADPSAELRVAAARSLGRIADPSSAGALAKALADGDEEVREAAARGLGQVGGEADVDALGKLLKDKNRLVRLAAIDALGAIGSAKALAVLAPQLADTDPAFKRHVVKAIGSLKDDSVAPYLKAWLSDKDPYLRGFTAEALAHRSPEKSLEKGLLALLDDEVWAVRVRAVEALGAWKSKAAVPALIKAVRAAEPTMRWKAAQALGAIGDVRAKEALEYLAEKDAELDIRKAAAEALKELK